MSSEHPADDAGTHRMERPLIGIFGLMVLAGLLGVGNLGVVYVITFLVGAHPTPVGYQALVGSLALLVVGVGGCVLVASKLGVEQGV